MQDANWDLIVTRIKERVIADSHAEIKAVIRDMHDANEIQNIGGTTTDFQIIWGKLESENEYRVEFNSDTYDYNVKKNPEYAFEKSMKDTNASIQALNNRLKWTNRYQLIIAALTAIFILGQLIQSCNASK